MFKPIFVTFSDGPLAGESKWCHENSFRVATLDRETMTITWHHYCVDETVVSGLYAAHVKYTSEAPMSEAVHEDD